MHITFDHRLQNQESVGSVGISAEHLHNALAEFESSREAIQQEKVHGKLGFAQLPYQDEQQLAPILELAQAIRDRFTAVIVIGIGGSDLGARAVHRALNHQFYNLTCTPKLFFCGDTTDPIALQEVLDVVDLTQTAVVVISKSGNTVEQMSTFLYLRAQLHEAVGEAEAAQHIIAITDEETGTLRELVRREGYRSLVIPSNVGGRFSVLSSVGLFPLAVVGIDIKALLEGAQLVDQYDQTTVAYENQIVRFAYLQHWHFEHGRPLSVLMPYSYGLREVGFWYRQLWAESLGKAVNRAGETVHTGPTPIASVGPTDQHSQAQLYMEGPVDKVVTFIRVEQTAHDLTVPSAFEDIEGVHYLAGTSFQQILLAEQESTALALAQQGRPSGMITVPVLDAFHLGQLLYFFEMATAYAGVLFDVNAFDQPGVELGKQYMYGLLGREGFTDPRV